MHLPTYRYCYHISAAQSIPAQAPEAVPSAAARTRLAGGSISEPIFLRRTSARWSANCQITTKTLEAENPALPIRPTRASGETLPCKQGPPASGYVGTGISNCRIFRYRFDRCRPISEAASVMFPSACSIARWMYST